MASHEPQEAMHLRVICCHHGGEVNCWRAKASLQFDQRIRKVITKRKIRQLLSNFNSACRDGLEISLIV